MTELDPYAVLRVSRTATREEIARAYRALAKRHHPDAGAPPSPAMARINDAWRVLSDPVRRARWERDHAVIVPPHWSHVPVEPIRPTVRTAPPSRMDSGWAVMGVVAAIGVLVAVAMIGISAASAPPDDRLRFESEELSFAYPSDWSLHPGDGTDRADHRVLAHLLTFPIEPAQLCTSFATPCELTGEAVPPGEASIIVTAWEGGEPPVPEPVVSRPYGLDADRIVGGKPAAFEVRRTGEDTFAAWWQLSPPDFPDRWIEIRADISAQEIEEAELLAEMDRLLATVEFGP